MLCNAEFTVCPCDHDCIVRYCSISQELSYSDGVETLECVGYEGISGLGTVALRISHADAGDLHSIMMRYAREVYLILAPF